MVELKGVGSSERPKRFKGYWHQKARAREKFGLIKTQRLVVAQWSGNDGVTLREIL